MQFWHLRFISMILCTAGILSTAAQGQIFTQQGPKLVGNGASELAQQGGSVALSANVNNFTGATWVFTRDSSGNWNQQGPKLVGTGAINGQLGAHQVMLRIWSSILADISQLETLACHSMQVAPCRILDTRSSSGQFRGTLAINIAGTSCTVRATGQGFVLNATIVPPGPLTYLTLWPDGQSQPFVSTLNALDGTITSNMAIAAGTNGSVDAFATDATHLILDLTGYFAP